MPELLYPTYKTSISPPFLTLSLNEVILVDISCSGFTKNTFYMFLKYKNMKP